jgi:parvulin-like peptidyl-prolyl isomerase
MILELAIVGACCVSIFGSSLAFADRVLRRQALVDKKKPEPTGPFAERRRILERQRDQWIDTANKTPVTYVRDRQLLLQEAAKVDELLLVLALEEEAASVSSLGTPMDIMEFARGSRIK